MPFDAYHDVNGVVQQSPSKSFGNLLLQCNGSSDPGASDPGPRQTSLQGLGHNALFKQIPGRHIPPPNKQLALQHESITIRLIPLAIKAARKFKSQESRPDSASLKAVTASLSWYTIMPLYQIHGYKLLSNYKEREVASAIINFHVQQFAVEAASVHVNFVYRCGESLDKWFHGPILVAPSISPQYPGRTSTLWDGRQGRDEYNVLLRVNVNSETNWGVFCEELHKLWDTAVNSGKGGHELKSIMIEKSLVHQWQSGKSVSLGLEAAPPYDGPPVALP